jgi:very-short-patch-repair endonuclease
VTGQKIARAKVAQSKDLRREMTPGEQRLWKELRGGKLNSMHFRRPQVIAGYIVDFYYHQAALVIELDGSVHLGSEAEDKKRERALVELGLRVLRFTNDQIEKDCAAILLAIARAIGRAAENRT